MGEDSRLLKHRRDVSYGVIPHAFQGNVLAQRDYGRLVRMKVFRAQCKLWWMIAAVALVAVGLAYLGTGYTRLGCGSASVVLTFRVVDDADARPIGGARIELLEDFSAPPAASATTGSDGLACVRSEFGATWYSGPFFREYRCVSYSDQLQVRADGYEAIDEPLRNFTKYPHYHNSPSPQPIVLRLKRSPGLMSRHE
jgi:hypothetical protein